jgi:hypothetical protein
MHLLVQATAEQTGLTPQQVMEQLAGGKTIVDIAGAKAPAVKAAALTYVQQQLAQQLAQISGALDALMSNSAGKPGQPLATPPPSS